MDAAAVTGAQGSYLIHSNVSRCDTLAHQNEPQRRPHAHTHTHTHTRTHTRTQKISAQRTCTHRHAHARRKMLGAYS